MEISQDWIDAVEATADNEALVQTYITLRDEKETRKRLRAEEDEPLDKLMEKIEVKLQKALQDNKVQSMKTKYGTFHFVKKTSAKVADWAVFLKHIIKTEGWDLLVHNCNKTAVQARMEETAKPVPGVDWTVFQGVQVKRS